MSPGTKKSGIKSCAGSTRYWSKSVVPFSARNESSIRKLPLKLFGRLKTSQAASATISGLRQWASPASPVSTLRIAAVAIAVRGHSALKAIRSLNSSVEALHVGRLRA